MLFLGFLLLSVVGGSRALPVDERQEDDPELTAGFFEGDIVLDASPRNGVKNSDKRWPKGIVYYKFMDGFFDKEQIHFIKDAMKAIENASCVRFKEAGDNQPYFVNITGTQIGCFSKVGFTARVQKFNLKPYPIKEGCFRFGSIMHELMHTLGFHHMQNTYNRDEYVQINKKNIERSERHNFQIYDKDLIEDFEAEYDYGSILHYPRRAFSKNGEKTIEPLKKVKKGLMGQRKALSEIDIYKLNKMYKCKKKH
ncbi:seminal metalloprotease 1-like [Zeugodacus cucurbitae]|uniref:seminal metalloprotease 1-like n=1 Tax=Zeugodacus cucurbitae TaxID=28588 RepID=UPI0005969AC4|nr:seminal metalloprotease 1-like [Zeugodacus cucurbitae]